MKAAIIEINGNLVVKDVRMPQITEYQALVKLSYGSTCAGTDLRLIQKGHPNPISYPAILGHESVGYVLSLGDKVRNFKVGDLIARVGTPPLPDDGINVCWGGFAQYGVAYDWQAMKQDGLPLEHWKKYCVNQVIPPDIDPKYGPMFITWRETLSYIKRMGIRSEQRVLIIGSGANSLAFLAHCVYANACCCVVGSEKRRELFSKLGAKEYIDYRSADISKNLTEAFPNGIDVIIDGVGNSDNVNIAMPFINQDATIGVYGWNNRNNYGINPFLARRSFKTYCDGYYEAETHDEIIHRIRQGALCAEDWYDTNSIIPLDEIALAYQRLKEGKALKYLIDLN